MAARWRPCPVGRQRLLCFVVFEKPAGFFEVEKVSVYGQLIDAGVVWNREDMLDVMATLPEGLNEKIDVYHACHGTGAGCTGITRDSK
jgi:hypothetical protein